MGSNGFTNDEDGLFIDNDIFDQERLGIKVAVNVLDFDDSASEVEDAACGTEAMLLLKDQWDGVKATTANYKRFYFEQVDPFASNIQKSINDASDTIADSLSAGKFEEKGWPFDPVTNDYVKLNDDEMDEFLFGQVKPSTVSAGDPVNMCNGNYINEHSDILLGGKYPVEFNRFYNARSEKEGALGLGWTHSFEIHAYEDKLSGKIKIRGSDGSTSSFVRYEDYYIEEHGQLGVLEKTLEGYIFRQYSGEYQRFDAEGYLTSFGDTDGDNIFFTYENTVNGKKRLKRLKTKNGGCLLFAYYVDVDNEGLIKMVTDHAGRSVSYTYDNKRLVEICGVDGSTRRISYTERGRIKAIVNPKGIVTVKNEYDELNRMVKQSFPDGSKMKYDYDDKNNTTTFTEQNGNRVVYTHDEQKRHTKTEYYDGVEHYTYNDRNQKISVTDKRGNVTRFAYDNRGLLTKIIDAHGCKTSITYRADGKLLSVKGPNGGEYRYFYDNDGRIIEIRNPLNESEEIYYNGRNIERSTNAAGADTLLRYDDRGNVISVTDPDGVTTEYKYDELNHVVESITSDGAITAYEYDSMDRIIKTTDALGNTREYSYDHKGMLTSVKEADGSFKTYEMNVMGYISEVKDEAGNGIKITYNEMGKQEKVILPNGGVVKYEYDPLMRLTKFTDPDGRTIGFDYDPNGNIVAEYNSDIKVKAYEYDALDRMTKETDALGHERTYKYNEDGQVIMSIDDLGNEYITDYDLLGRVISEKDPLGNVVTYTYTKLGAVESITDAYGRTRRYEYTDGGRLKSEWFCGKEEQQLTYDKAGRISERSFADGYRISYNYDVLGRVSCVEGSDGRLVSYEYDAMGRATKVTDGSRTTFYTYTATGRLKSVVDALGNETAYTYDALDNLESICRAEGRIDNSDDKMPVVGKDGHVTIYSYNLSGQLTTITDALGQEEIYEYDQYGRLISKTDRDNFVTNYTYNSIGDVTSVGYGDGRSVEFAYNELNQLKEINDWLGRTTFERDVLGHITKVTDYQNRSVAYEYNSIGEKTKLVYPDGRVASYKYDEEGKLSSIIGNGEETRYFYDVLGRLTAKFLPNGVKQAYSYIPGGNLESITSSNKDGQLDKYFYSYDNSGLISGIYRSRRGLKKVSGQYDYQYDANGRLIQTSLNGQVKSLYEYDAFGNRISRTENGVTTSYKYDVLDRLMQVNELNNSHTIIKTYDYDKRGNQTKEFSNGLLQKSFTFDATNMLSKVVDKDKGELENFYNGLGFRVASTRPEERIEYLCDLSRDYHNLLERTVNGEKESFVYDNNVVSMCKTGNTYYYLQDELGSPMYMTGTDGGTVSAYAFDDFGRDINPFSGMIKESGAKHAYSTDGNIIQPFAFTGYQKDDVSGLRFAQARYYNANDGRFVGEDQVRGFANNPDTINHYLYCFNSPVKYVDLNGKCADEVDKVNNNAGFIANLVEIGRGIAEGVSKFCKQTSEYIRKQIKKLPNIGGKAKTKNRIMTEEAAGLEATSRRASEIEGDLKCAGDAFTVASVIASMVAEWMKKKDEPMDKRINDTGFEGSFTLFKIGTSTMAGEAVGSAIAGLCAEGGAVAAGAAGVGTAGAAAVALPIVAAIGVAIVVDIVIDKIADIEVDGKTIKEHAKDFMYSSIISLQESCESIKQNVFSF